MGLIRYKGRQDERRWNELDYAKLNRAMKGTGKSERKSYKGNNIGQSWLWGWARGRGRERGEEGKRLNRRILIRTLKNKIIRLPDS